MLPSSRAVVGYRIFIYNIQVISPCAVGRSIRARATWLSVRERRRCAGQCRRMNFACDGTPALMMNIM